MKRRPWHSIAVCLHQRAKVRRLQMLGSPFAGRFALGAGPFAVALVGTHHQDYRYRRGIGGELSPERDARTSNLPFQALLLGNNEWSPLAEELKLVNCGIALGLAGLMFINRIKLYERN